MNRIILATALLLAALPCAARADAASEPGKGVGKLGCVRPIVPGTRGHGIITTGGCEIVWARFQSGWCARALSDAKDWPWRGPAADRATAAILAWHDSYGHGC